MSNEQLHLPVRTGSGVKLQFLSLKSKIKHNILYFLITSNSDVTMNHERMFIDLGLQCYLAFHIFKSMY
jgi:hypothetical protein